MEFLIHCYIHAVQFDFCTYLFPTHCIFFVFSFQSENVNVNVKSTYFLRPNFLYNIKSSHIKDQ